MYNTVKGFKKTSKGVFMNPKFKKHFRIYLRSNHPAYIIGEDGDCYLFHRVTSSPKNGRHLNWMISPNPDTKRKTPMFIVKKKQRDKKKRFGKRLNYNFKNEFKIKSD